MIFYSVWLAIGSLVRLAAMRHSVARRNHTPLPKSAQRRGKAYAAPSYFRASARSASPASRCVASMAPIFASTALIGLSRGDSGKRSASMLARRYLASASRSSSVRSSCVPSNMPQSLAAGDHVSGTFPSHQESESVLMILRCSTHGNASNRLDHIRRYTVFLVRNV